MLPKMQIPTAKSRNLGQSARFVIPARVNSRVSSSGTKDWQVGRAELTILEDVGRSIFVSFELNAKYIIYCIVYHRFIK